MSNKKLLYMVGHFSTLSGYGDHERDIQTAKNANVKSIACTYGYYESDPLSWGADYIIDSLIEIKKIL